MKIENYKYKSFHIANTIIALSKNNNIKTNLLKLMKLSYISVGYCLSFEFDPFREDIQAWKYGPVIPSLWHEFKEFSLYDPIDRLGKYRNSEGGISTGIIEDNSSNNTDSFTYNVILFVMNKYLENNSWELVDKTHEEFTPWKKYEERVLQKEKNIIIPKTEIKDYYKELLKDEFKN